MQCGKVFKSTKEIPKGKLPTASDVRSRMSNEEQLLKRIGTLTVAEKFKIYGFGVVFMQFYVREQQLNSAA